MNAIMNNSREKWGGVEGLSVQPELWLEPGTKDLIGKDLRNFKPFRDILFFLRHHMG